MSEEIDIIPEIRILAKRPGEKNWSEYYDPTNRELMRALCECEIFSYKILKRFFNEPQDNRKKSEVRL